MRLTEIEKLQQSKISETVEYDDAKLYIESFGERKIGNCKDCYFFKKEECMVVPCSEKDTIDEKDRIYIKVE